MPRRGCDGFSNAHDPMPLIQCPECGAQVSDQAPQCIQCGFPLDFDACPVCRQAVPRDATACPSCGHPLTPGAGRGDGRGTEDRSPVGWFLAAFAKYAVFKGRARRKEFWYFQLFNFLVIFALALLEALVDPSGEGGVLVGLYQLAQFLPAVAVGVRRMHDTGRSGWWILLPIANLIFWVEEGDIGPNKYGPDPIGRRA